MSSWSMPSPETPMPPTSTPFAIDRHAAREDLDAVLQPVLAGLRRRAGGAARRRVGRAPSTKPRCWPRLPMISADCRPVENGLNWAIGRENGPFGLPTSPSGKKGRDRLPIGAVGEGGLAGQRGRDRGGSRAPSCTKLRTSALGSASRSDAACVPEKNVAVRAFCSDTSMPKIGASGARTRPRIAPWVSTTDDRHLGAAVERLADRPRACGS